MTRPFADRADVGRQLATRLARYATERPVVLALPRGGVPVGYEIAQALHAPLDVLAVRKLRAPAHPELGIGAVVDGDHPERVMNDDVVDLLGVSRLYIEQEAARQLEEIHRRQDALRGERPPVALAGRTVIVVDDGVATGGTIRAALRGVRGAHPRRVVLAIGVAPPETARKLEREADDFVCLATPPSFGAVGQFYRDFRQVTDAEVVDLLARAAVAEGYARASGNGGARA